MAAPIYIPPIAHEVSLFSTFLPAFICGLFDDSHFDGCEVIAHVVLIHISLMISNVEHLFMCSWGYLYVFYGKRSIHVFFSFLIFFIAVLQGFKDLSSLNRDRSQDHSSESAKS